MKMISKDLKISLVVISLHGSLTFIYKNIIKRESKLLSQIFKEMKQIENSLFQDWTPWLPWTD